MVLEVVPRTPVDIQESISCRNLKTSLRPFPFSPEDLRPPLPGSRTDNHDGHRGEAERQKDTRELWTVEHGHRLVRRLSHAPKQVCVARPERGLLD